MRERERERREKMEERSKGKEREGIFEFFRSSKLLFNVYLVRDYFSFYP